MKKYKRWPPVIPPIIIAVPTVCFAVATVIGLVYYLSCGENTWVIVFGSFFACFTQLLILDLFLQFLKYSYDNSCIYFSFLSFVYRKESYSKYTFAVISNAAVNNGYGGVNSNATFRYKQKRETGIVELVYPCLTLHKSEYPINKVRSQMTSRDLFMLDDCSILHLGICHFESLTELVAHTDIPIYVLEDVYLRYRESFDSIFSSQVNDIHRFYIIRDYDIKYTDYLAGNQNN